MATTFNAKDVTGKSDHGFMKIFLVTDDIIMNKQNNLKQITNPIKFEKIGVPTDDGLFSNKIFGVTQEERMKTWAYIDLKEKFFHPYVYEILIKLYRNVEKVAQGVGSWKIDKDGKLKMITDMEDPDYNEDNTGLTWLINNYHKIKFELNDSYMRNERLRLLNNLTDKELFISKWLVCPVFYRDVDMNAKVLSVPPINKSYSKLIQYTNSLSDTDIGFISNMTKFNIQNILVSIRKDGQKLVELKHGWFKRAVIGKNVDYGVRSVITAPVIDSYNKTKEVPIDIYHTGIPLSQCCVLGFPFIIRWLNNFFANEFENIGSRYPIHRKDKDGKETVEYIELDDPMGMYTQEYIHKKVDIYRLTETARFDPILIPLKGGKFARMVFSGRGYTGKNANDPRAATISNRYLTWTDVIYMAAYHTCQDKYAYITRYPLVDYFGTFPSQVHVLSTIKTMPCMINGTLYKYYPYIDPSYSKDQIATAFNDTITMSNLYLKGLGGDYDGDTVSAKMVFTEEANEEAATLLHNIKHFISLQGNLMRSIGNEAFLTLYNMTMD